MLHGAGLAIPVHIFDLHTAYLAASNILRPQTGKDAAFKKPKKDLAAACRAYGLRHASQRPLT
jgi:hypothetical protein